MGPCADRVQKSPSISHCLYLPPRVTLGATALHSEGALSMVGQTILVRGLVFKTSVAILINNSKGGD